MRAAFACASVILLAAGAFAAPQRAAQVETQVKRVALFKNGLGFFTRGGSLPREAGPLKLEPFSAPSHGTLWVSYPTNVGMGPIIASEATVEDERQAVNLPELLRANVGKNATLWLTVGQGEPGAVTGKILSFAEDRKPEVGDRYAMGMTTAPGGARYGPQDLAGRLVLVQTESGVVAINPQQIQRADFADADVSTTLSEESRALELSAELKKPARDAWVRVSYLAKGIAWAPSYLVDISEPKKARIAAKAVIINEAEDLKGAHVDLVTGFPNLQFADIASPVAYKEDLARFLQALTRGRSESEERYARGVTTQAAAFGGYAGYGVLDALAGPAGPMPEYGAAAVGRVAEDLFLYPLENITLAKGDRAYYPLFTETVPYEEIYQWQIPDYINEQDQYGRQSDGREQPEQPEVVWHSLKLTNSTKVPWTTAPAETVKDDQILGQDTLPYTPPTAEGTLRITQALGVKAEQTELEVSRQRGAVEYYGYQYDRVTVEGRLRVRNYLDKQVSLEIVKILSGEVKKMSPEAKVQQLARGLKRMNPMASLTWTVEFKPGAERELTYVYEALIRR